MFAYGVEQSFHPEVGMFRFGQSLACCAAALCMMSGVAMAEKIKNPEYEMWAKFKVGAMAKIEGKTIAAGQESKQVIVNKLLELSADKAVVETTVEMEMMGQKMAMPPQKRDVPAEVEKVNIDPKNGPAPTAESKTSEETITAAGKSFDCKVTETTFEQAGSKSVAKMWACPDVPGGMVKTEAKTTGSMESTSTMTLIEFSTGG